MAQCKVLVVDDSPTFMNLMATPLKEQGYHVVTAVDGEEALAKAVSEHPELIVLDVILPKKNGFQVCRQLKTAPDTKDIKIMMLTSKTQDSDRFWGTKQGADVYMTKPFDTDEYLQAVKALVNA
ncbi:MAG: response regulator [Desulfobacterales bacterium]|nr:response regulator [Desulfobacterales bacterium]